MASGNQLTDVIEDLAARATATHLVVFQHGLFGSEADLANAAALFKVHLGSPHHDLYAYNAQCNATSVGNLLATCDGIDCGAERLACEIVRVAESMPRLEKFSLVGHSMGGLYARYCLGVLYSRGFFDRIEPVNFVTLATPHLGNRRPPRGSINWLYNAIAPKLFDRTGQQFALLDHASAEAIALSQCVDNKYPHRVSHAAYQEMDGLLPVRITMEEPSKRNDAEFTPHRCMLRDRVLSIYPFPPDAISPEYTLLDNSPDINTPETETLDEKAVVRMDLTRADVTLVLPDKTPDEAEVEWDILVQPKESSTSYTLRLHHSELATQWKWIPAISNASLGLHSRTPSSSSVSSLSPAAPPLLSCLTRGQFLLALQLFRVRTLYATVFNDHTVPYSCAAVRAYNPFRQSPSALLVTSPSYPHIVHASLSQVQRLRDTRKSFESTTEGDNEFVRNQEIEEPTGSNGDASTSVCRPKPFTDGDVLLDRVDAAFTTDDARDTLRAMLIAVQSVGWRRLDVQFDSLLAHELIIAKRADVANAKASSDGGLDILYHLLDTFEL